MSDRGTPGRWPTVKLETLPGWQTKDDDAVKALVLNDMQVAYDFDRTHGNVRDVHWAASPSRVFEFRF